MSYNPVLSAEYVTFSGGGTRGFCLPAAVQAVEDFMIQYGHGHFLERIRGFAGASIGALFAMLYAAGYTSRALKEEVFGRDFNRIFENANPINYLSKWALDDGQLLEVWIEDLLERRYGKWARKITFEQFEREARKQLVVAVVVIPDNASEYTLYVSAQNYPHKGVAHVVRISMAMTGLFSPVREPMDGDCVSGGGENGVSGGPSSSSAVMRRTALWSDGANVESIPFKVWGGQKTIGFLLMPNKISPVRTALDYYQRILSIYSSRASESYIQSLTPNERQCIVEVECPQATIDLNTSQADKQRMFETATTSVQRYLTRYSNDLLRDAILTISRWATENRGVGAGVTNARSVAEETLSSVEVTATTPSSEASDDTSNNHHHATPRPPQQ